MKAQKMNIDGRNYFLIEGYSIYDMVTNNKDYALSFEDGKEEIEKGFMLLDKDDFNYLNKIETFETDINDILFFRDIEDIQEYKDDMEIEEIRCNNCNKLLLEGNFEGKINVKCNKCKQINTIIK